MYDSADTKRLSKELLAGVSQGGDPVQIQCTDEDDTNKTFNRLNVQRHRQGIKDVRINYNLVTFVLTIVQKAAKVSGNPDKRQMSENQDKTVSPEIKTKRKRPTMLHAAPVEAYEKTAVAIRRLGRYATAEGLRELAENTAEAINAQGGLEAADTAAVPWEDVKAELGITGTIMAEHEDSKIGYELPEAVEIDMSDYPIQDQGALGASVAFSTAAAMHVATRSQEPAQAAQTPKRTRARAATKEDAPVRRERAGLPPVVTLDLWAGARCREKGKCYQCGGELILASDRHYHQRLFEESAVRAYTVDICCNCVGHEVK